jgi:predicted secreted protein
MAYPTTHKGQKVALQLGDGATPTENFTTVCGITTKGLQRTKQTTDTVVWDCTDPDADPIIERDVMAGDWTMTGSGQAVLAHLEDIEDAYDTPANWRIVFFGTGTTVVRSYTGQAIMTDLTLGAVNGERASISLTLAGSGTLTRDIPT